MVEERSLPSDKSKDTRWGPKVWFAVIWLVIAVLLIVVLIVTTLNGAPPAA